MSHEKRDDLSPQEGEGPVTNRREFLGKTAMMAAAAVGAPALLAACDSSATAPAQAETPTAAGAAPSAVSGTVGSCVTHVSRQPWWAVHYTVAGTIGSTTYVKVPTLEKGTYGYTQRVITDDSRIGTALATVLRRDYKWDNGALTLIVQDGRGKAWSRRSIASQADLAYAMKDALATNSLGYGVLRDSLTKGKPVVAVVKSSIIKYFDSVASDYWGNRLKPAHCAFSGVFNSAVSDIAITTTIYDQTRC
ncbi:MAG TPA: twin-arginine translocation signal domain-containing protein [Longimicrobium sp.]|nr:twin-arginine translocation signal domain-containing protein [Longimicrobium sp.]